KGRLAAHAAKGGGNVDALAVLQQHHYDQHHADKYVNHGNKSNQHSVSVRPFKILVRKGGFEPPRLSAPPPQDGVSASFTTSALAFTCKPHLCAENADGSRNNEEKLHYSKPGRPRHHAYRSAPRCILRANEKDNFCSDRL